MEIEMTPVASLKDLPDILRNHSLVLITDGKILVGNLPAYGDVQIVCKDKKAKRIKVLTEQQL